MIPAYTTAESMWGDWERNLTSGKPATRYVVAPQGSPLHDLRVGPRQVVLFGGAPGAGKTALVMQLVTDALMLQPSLRALVANVEMPPEALLDRQMSRLSGVSLSSIVDRCVPENQQEAFLDGMKKLKEISPRLGLLSSPFSAEHLAEAADDFRADILVVDYLQRFVLEGDFGSKKEQVDALMSTMRAFANTGVAVLAVAAVGRQRDERGRTGYSGLNLSSFRESSEIEYGADDAFLLTKGKRDEVTLHHAKCRNGEPKDRTLRFIGNIQRFVCKSEMDVQTTREKVAPVNGGDW